MKRNWILALMVAGVLAGCEVDTSTEKPKEPQEEEEQNQPTTSTDQEPETEYDPYNGHAYIDMGEDFDVVWATMNIGATTTEDYGNYYSWGEIEIKDEYSWENYAHGNGSEYCQLTKYCYNSGYGYDGFTDNKKELDLEDDVAHKEWGGKWRIPTKKEWQDLEQYCIWTQDKSNNGYKATIYGTDKSIFFPAAGYRGNSDFYRVGSYGAYWANSLGTSTDRANYMRLETNAYHNVGESYRQYGRSVRAVADKPKQKAESRK